MVVVSQHFQNIETLNKTQNKQVQELYLQNPTSLEDNDSARDQVQGGGDTRYQDLEKATSRNDQTQMMKKATGRSQATRPGISAPAHLTLHLILHPTPHPASASVTRGGTVTVRKWLSTRETTLPVEPAHGE